MAATITYTIGVTAVDVFRHPRVKDWRFYAFDDAKIRVATGKGYTRAWSAKRGAQRAFPKAEITVSA
jgi:hypothetical protein